MLNPNSTQSTTPQSCSSSSCNNSRCSNINRPLTTSSSLEELERPQEPWVKLRQIKRGCYRASPLHSKDKSISSLRIKIKNSLSLSGICAASSLLCLRRLRVWRSLMPMNHSSGGTSPLQATLFEVSLMLSARAIPITMLWYVLLRSRFPCVELEALVPWSSKI